MSIKITGAALGKSKMWLNTLGDCWENVWAEDGNIYAVADDSNGVKENGETIIDRSDGPHTNFTVNVFTGNDADSLRGRTINRMMEYGIAGPYPENITDGCSWKAMGITSVDNTLYVSIARHDYSGSSEDCLLRQTSRNASIIKSSDKGVTWTRPYDENLKSPMFLGGKFGAPYFIHYGKAGDETAHNSDKYVYAISNNGFWNNGDSVKLGRVRKSAIGNLNAADWEYYAGGDGMNDGSWSKNINHVVNKKAGYLLNAPGKCSMAGAQYIEALDRYVMIQWYYTAVMGIGGWTGMDSPWHETAWNFYESPYPWGPWRRFSSHIFNPLAFYNPCIASKFISDDGKNLLFSPTEVLTRDKRPEINLYTGCIQSNVNWKLI